MAEDIGRRHTRSLTRQMKTDLSSKRKAPTLDTTGNGSPKQSSSGQQVFVSSPRTKKKMYDNSDSSIDGDSVTDPIFEPTTKLDTSDSETSNTKGQKRRGRKRKCPPGSALNTPVKKKTPGRAGTASSLNPTPMSVSIKTETEQEIQVPCILCLYYRVKGQQAKRSRCYGNNIWYHQKHAHGLTSASPCWNLHREARKKLSNFHLAIVKYLKDNPRVCPICAHVIAENYSMSHHMAFEHAFWIEDGPNNVDPYMVVGATPIGSKLRVNKDVARKNLENFYRKYSPQYVAPLNSTQEGGLVDDKTNNEDETQTPDPEPNELTGEGDANINDSGQAVDCCSCVECGLYFRSGYERIHYMFCPKLNYLPTNMSVFEYVDEHHGCQHQCTGLNCTHDCAIDCVPVEPRRGVEPRKSIGNMSTEDQRRDEGTPSIYTTIESISKTLATESPSKNSTAEPQKENPMMEPHDENPETETTPDDLEIEPLKENLTVEPPEESKTIEPPKESPTIEYPNETPVTGSTSEGPGTKCPKENPTIESPDQSTITGSPTPNTTVEPSDKNTKSKSPVEDPIDESEATERAKLLEEFPWACGAKSILQLKALQHTKKNMIEMGIPGSQINTMMETMHTILVESIVPLAPEAQTIRERIEASQL